MSEIRDLVESYYSDVYIEEEQLDEMGGTTNGRVTGSNPNVYRPSSAPYRPGGGRQQANMNRSSSASLATRTNTQTPPPAPKLPSPEQADRMDAAAGRTSRIAPRATLPTGRPNLNLRVASPSSGVRKVAPTAPSTPAAPKGDAMSQWAAANPKLAAAKAERDRTRGTSATTNPQMDGLRSRLQSPSTPSPTTAKTGFDLAKKGIDLSKK